MSPLLSILVPSHPLDLKLKCHRQGQPCSSTLCKNVHPFILHLRLFPLDIIYKHVSYLPVHLALSVLSTRKYVRAEAGLVHCATPSPEKREDRLIHGTQLLL